ncbi:MAG: hypothetical protein HKL81_10155 [Acidimicrobiaceae bacterium]|nr:hypothetical protein [Acidimicrobiaceae bacterium]
MSISSVGMQQNINKYSTISGSKKASDGDGDHGIESSNNSNSSTKTSNSQASNASQANSGPTKPQTLLQTLLLGKKVYL